MINLDGEKENVLCEIKKCKTIIKHKEQYHLSMH